MTLGHDSLTLRGAPRPLFVELRPWLAGLLTGLLGFAALVLLLRRMAGALREPLPPATLLLAGLATATAALLVRLAVPAGSKGPTWFWLPCLLTGTIGWQLALSSASTAAIAGLWLLLATAELGAWFHLSANLQVPQAIRLRRWLSRSRQADRASNRTGVLGPAAEDVVQQFSRSRSSDGTETVAGRWRVAFAAEQRTAWAHVAFCPPFPETPGCEYRQVEGPPARIKLGQLLPYGARLELKLSQPGPASVVIEFQATNPPAPPRTS
jgi:hypothetical protein